MKIVLRPHLKLRLRERKIPLNYPGKITKEADQIYFDNSTGHNIAVKNLEYNGKVRPMITAYDIIGIEIQIITVHPSTDKEIDNKLVRKRWSKNEKN